MKIVVVGTAYPLRGGIAHYNGLLARHLAKRHTVETITFKRQYPSILFPGKTQAESGVEQGLTPAPQLVDSVNPFNWNGVAKIIRQQSPDLVIFKYWLPFFGPCFGTIAKFVKKKSRAKVLFICDNIIPHERRPGDVLFTKYAFRQADAFIVQSAAVERDLNKYFPGSRYRNVPHPEYENFGAAIPKEEARTKLAISSKRVLLFFGYIRAYKGVMVLLDAVRRAVDRGWISQDFLLLVVGEFYEDESRYRAKVGELRLEEHIRFVPDYVPNDRVAAYFGAADAVVLPYLSATQSGITQIAYHFEKPVIATDVGGLAEVVVDGKSGYIVPPNDPDALASRINDFYAGNKEEEFTKGVALEKKKYSWDRLVEAIEELAG